MTTTERSARTTGATGARGLAPALLLLLAAAPSPASAWWNSEWTSRKPLRLDTSAAGADLPGPIGPAAVLVRLHLGNFRFDAAQESGADLRFVAQDERTVLPHHLEKYDALLGEALVWVGLPDLPGGAQTTIWLYYGNPNAPPAEDAKGTYDPGTALVYHFAEANQPPRDWSGTGNGAAGQAPAAEGALVGRGLRLDGAAAITVPPSPSLAWTAGGAMSWSLWIRPASADATGVLFARRGASGAVTIGLEAGKPYVDVQASGSAERATAAAAVAAGGWHHVAVTAGSEVVLYVDGAPSARLKASLPALDGPSTMGGEAAAPGAPAPRPGFQGDVDELQLARVERSPGHVRAAAIAQGNDPSRFLFAGQDEELGGGESGYFGILIRSVTFDGWIVIGLLAIMSAVSIWVMFEKASYLRATERANDRFQGVFVDLSADLSSLIASAERDGMLGQPRALRASSLHRLFLIAAHEVGKRTEARPGLRAEAIESIRASLDAGLVRENQRLSRLMVLLTIAISGGPFLGLLGTVVGVMITFASIAAAGDVNVNAIAPGIAAALVATVAGLGVAIPALFAYNWLLTRAKNVTATMQVFVDELVTKIAETYAEPRAREEHHPRPTAVASE